MQQKGNIVAFDLYEPLLNPGGVIISDNVMYHGLVTTKEKIENRRTRGLIRRIKTYNEWLMNHEGYDTTIFPIGDGVAVSKREGDQGMKKPELLVTPKHWRISNLLRKQEQMR